MPKASDTFAIQTANQHNIDVTLNGLNQSIATNKKAVEDTKNAKATILSPGTTTEQKLKAVNDNKTNKEAQQQLQAATENRNQFMQRVGLTEAYNGASLTPAAFRTKYGEGADAGYGVYLAALPTEQVESIYNSFGGHGGNLDTGTTTASEDKKLVGDILSQKKDKDFYDGIVGNGDEEAFKKLQLADKNLKYYQEKEANGELTDFDKTAYAQVKSEYDTLVKGLSKYGDMDKALRVYGQVSTDEWKQSLLGKAVDFIDRHPVIGGVTMTAASVLSSPVRGLIALEGTLEDLSGNETFGVNDILNEFSEAVTSEVSNNIYKSAGGGVKGTIAKWCYSAAVSSMESALTMAAGAALMGVPVSGIGALESGAERILAQLGTDAIFFANASTETYREALERGLDLPHALLTAGFAGAAEVFFEKFSLDRAYDVLQAGGHISPSALADLLISGGIEGSEELFTSGANTLTDWIINGEGSEIVQKYAALRRSGMSDEEAKKDVALETAKQYGEDFIVGMLSGMFGKGGLTTVMDAANIPGDIRTGAAVKQAIGMGKLTTGDIYATTEGLGNGYAKSAVGKLTNDGSNITSSNYKTGKAVRSAVLSNMGNETARRVGDIVTDTQLVNAEKKRIERRGEKYKPSARFTERLRTTVLKNASKEDMKILTRKNETAEQRKEALAVRDKVYSDEGINASLQTMDAVRLGNGGTLASAVREAAGAKINNITDEKITKYEGHIKKAQEEYKTIKESGDISRIPESSTGYATDAGRAYGITDGGEVIIDKSGASAPMSSVNFTDEESANLFAEAGKMVSDGKITSNAMNAFLSVLAQNTDLDINLDERLRYMAQAYEYGKKGADFDLYLETITGREASDAYMYLGDSEIRFALDLGRDNFKAEPGVTRIGVRRTLSKKQENQLIAIDAFAKKYGLTIIVTPKLYANGQTLREYANGVENGKVIILSLAAEDNALTVAAFHEAFHMLPADVKAPLINDMMRQLITDEGENFRNIFYQRYVLYNTTTAEDKASLKATLKELDFDGDVMDQLAELFGEKELADTYEEIAAQYAGTLLSRDDVLAELAEKNPTGLKKFVAEIKKFLTEVKNYIAYLAKHDETAAAALRKDAKEAADLAERITDALEKAELEQSGAERYSLQDVEPVMPKSASWKRTLTTAEAMQRFPDLWNVTADESEVRNPTQVQGTVSTYRKIYDILAAENFSGTILDASSGLGYGTRAGREEYGYDVDDIEPYPDKSYKPKYTDYSTLFKKYDVIISNAVLNVLPQDQRDALTVKMGQMLNPGGRMFVNVRKNDVMNAKSKVVIDEDDWEVYISDSGSYQKGFRQNEIVAYMQDALGDDFIVEPTKKFGGMSVIVTKKADAAFRYDYADDKHIVDSFGIERINDTVHVQKKVFDTLVEENFFNGEEEKSVFSTNEESGMIVEINRTSINETFGFENFTHVARKIKSMKLAIIRDIPNLIRTGTITQNSVKNLHDKTNPLRYVYIENKIFVNGEPHELTIVVRKSKNKNLFWVHQIDIKKGSISRSMHLNEKAKELQSNATKDKVAQKETKVNNKNSSSHQSLQTSDAEYMDAVEHGDMETAQRMVDEAAKAAGYDYHLYHGTDAEFTSFDPKKFGGKTGRADGYGIYLANKREVSAVYGGRIIDAYVKFGRLAEGDKVTLTKAELKKLIKYSCEADAKMAVDDGEYDTVSEALKDTWVSNYADTYGYNSMAQVYSEVADTLLENDNDGDIINEIMIASGKHYDYESAIDFYDNVLTPTTGIDGFHYAKDKGNDVYLAFDSEQIKSADSVTYDDNGNVIPLSERFNKENTDIRYSKQTLNEEELKNSASMTEERIDYLIADSGAGMRKDYAQAWITSINPTDFLNLTLLKKNQNRDVFDKMPGDYGTNVNEYDYIEGLKNEKRQTPYLAIDVKTGKVVGHEGRHRMRALEKLGVTSVDIRIEFRDKNGSLVKEKNGYGNPLDVIGSLTIYNQRGTGQSATINNIIPLNKANRENIMQSYGNKDASVRYSKQTDSEGNVLSEQQAEYFANSKVRDEDGKLLAMYHGTPNAGFSIFRSGTYFTQNKDYADLYQGRGASSLGYKKTADNPDTYSVYLNITKPFDTRNKKERDIFRREYLGKWGMGTDLMESGLPDWMDGMDLQEFIEENGYDYDGLILDEGGVGGYGDEVKSRGLSYVIFSPEQVKDRGNKTPTQNKDYKLSKQTGDLYSEIYDKKIELGDLERKYDALKKSPEYETLMQESVRTDDIDSFVKRYSEYMKRSGIDELYKQIEALKKEIETLSNDFEKERINAAAEKERTDVEKSGKTEAEYFTGKAIKEFGYTPYFYDAGYVLPNGKMLNFSGEKNRHFGSRGQDHRAIGIVFETTSGSNAMIRFMKYGNIRIMAETPGIDIISTVEPTAEQYATIRKFANSSRGEEFFSVDLTDENGYPLGDLSYENSFSGERVVNDIKHFFATGEIRGQSEYEKFRYSRQTSRMGAKDIAAMTEGNEELETQVGVLSDIATTAARGIAKQMLGAGWSRDKAMPKDEKLNDIVKNALVDKEDRKALKVLRDWTKDFLWRMYNGAPMDMETAISELTQLVKMQALSAGYYEQIDDSGKELRQRLKGTKIYLQNEALGDIRSAYGSVQKANREVYPWIILTTQEGAANEGATRLDVLYDDLLTEGGYALTEEARHGGAVEMLRELSSILRSSGEMFVSAADQEGLTGETLDEWSQQAAVNTLAKIYEVGYSTFDKNSKIAEKIKTIEEIRAKMEADIRTQTEQAMKAADERVQRVIDKAAADAQTQKTTFDLELQAEKERSKAALEELAKNARERYDERTRRARERREDVNDRRRMRAQIVKKTKKLNDLLIHESDQKHIPEEFKKYVIMYLEMMTDDTSVFDSRRISRLKNAYAKMNENSADDVYSSSGIAGSYDEDIAAMLDALYEYLYDAEENGEKIRLSQLDNQHTRYIKDIVDHLYKIISDANENFVNGKREKTSELGQTMMAEAAAHKEAKTHGDLAETGINFLSWKMAKPVYAFKEKLGGVAGRFFDDFRDAQDLWYVRAKEGREKIKQLKKDTGYKTWKDEKTDFTFDDGWKATLTKEAVMQIYATFKREMASGMKTTHIQQGGIVLSDELNREQKKKIKDAKGHALTLADITQIANSLTDEQKKYADGLVDFLSTTVGGWGNEASMELSGIRKYTEKYYFPFQSSDNYLYSRFGVTDDTRLKHTSFTNRTQQNASTPLIVSSFTDVAAGHIQQMAMYSAFVNPIENFTRVYNYKDRNAGTSVKAALENAYGKGANEYIAEFMKAMNGGMRSDRLDNLFNKPSSMFKRAAVMANLSVIVQQPSAIARSMALIDPKYWLGGVNKADYAEMLKYNPIAGIKEMGGFDTGTAQSAAEWIAGESKLSAKITDALGVGAELADRVTWINIWNACKRETKAEHKDVQLGSDEFYKIASARFRDVIEYTQVYDSTLTKSELMRGKGALTKMITAFMAEPTTSYNLLFARGHGNTIHTGRAVTAFVLATMLNAALKSIVGAMRDDDDDYTYWEKYIARLVGSLTGSKEAGFLDSEFSPIGLIPWVKDLVSLWAGYDVNRSDISVFADLIDAAQKFINAWQDENVPDFDEWTDMIAAITSLTPVPTKNALKDFRGLYNTIRSAVDDTMTFDKNTLRAAIKAEIGFDSGKPEKAYYAVLNGDKETEARMTATTTADIQKYISDGYTEEEAEQNAIVAKYRQFHKYVVEGMVQYNDDIVKAAEAKFKGQTSGYEGYVNKLKAQGFTQNDIVTAVDKLIDTKLRIPELEAEEMPDDKDLYKMQDAYDQFDNRNLTGFKNVKAAMIEAGIKDEKSINSNMKKRIKGVYEAGTMNTAQTAQALIDYADMTEAAAKSQASAWEFELAYPDSTLDEKDVKKFYEELSPHGITLKTYEAYYNATKDAEGATKKAQVMAAIDALPISNEQKDTFYYFAGYASSRIYEAPWH